MSEELKGKTALITGSTSGIGLGIAKCFAEQGINIVMNGFGEENEIEQARLELENYGIKALYHGADMRKAEEIKDLVSFAEKEIDGLDIVINNAGIQNVQPVEDFPEEKWQAILDINLSSGFHVVKNTISTMRNKGWGRIINMASAHALVASPYKSAYVAAKHGILGFTKTIALEVAQDNITCNAICPGYVWTPLVENQVKDTAKARNISEEEVIKDVLLAAQWTKKFVTVEQIGRIALFLCSNAAENITGTHITVDGGWSAA